MMNLRIKLNPSVLNRGPFRHARRTGLVSILVLALPVLVGCQTLGGGGMSLFGGTASAASAENSEPKVAEASEAEKAVVTDAKTETAKVAVVRPKRKPASIAAAKEETTVFEKVAAAEKVAAKPAAKKRAEGPNSKTITGLVRTYDKYRGDLAFAAQASFENRAAITEAHKRLAKYDPQTLSRAWIAYNASVAAQTPAYSQEIGKKTNKRGPERFLNSLHRKSDAVMKLKSSPKAVRSVLYNVSEETSQMTRMAGAYKQIAIDLQTGRTTNVSMAAERAELVKAGFSGEMVLASSRTNLKVSQAAVTAQSRPVLGKMLILGAHISTEQSEGKYKPHTTQLSDYKKGQQCLKWAKLNLAQCIAATRDVSEQAYCTGRHGINEVSDCWSFMTLTGNPA